jgi:hypothetical protein
MTANGTVEFGADRPSSWLDRLLGEPDKAGRRKVSTPALGCALVALALITAAELLPWMTVSVTPESSPTPPLPVGDDQELYVEQVGTVVLVGYYLGWLVLITLIGMVLVARRTTRRLVTGAALGVAAAQLVFVAGLSRRVVYGGEYFAGSRPHSSFGPGVFLAFAALALFVAALITAGWRPGPRGGRRRRAPELDVDRPPDLSVTGTPRSPLTSGS